MFEKSAPDWAFWQKWVGLILGYYFTNSSGHLPTYFTAENHVHGKCSCSRKITSRGIFRTEISRKMFQKSTPGLLVIARNYQSCPDDGHLVQTEQNSRKVANEKHEHNHHEDGGQPATG
jgi:hypothetical protein